MQGIFQRDHIIIKYAHLTLELRGLPSLNYCKLIFLKGIPIKFTGNKVSGYIFMNISLL